MKSTLALAALLAAVTAATPSTAGDQPGISDVLMDKTKGCMAEGTEQFGRYIGDWNIEDQRLQQDGTTWVPGNGARWLFTCVGDGIAVQDFWMPNGPDGTLENAPGVGTNLRIYDPTNERWDIAWTATRAPAMLHIRAKLDDKNRIIMHDHAPKQNPPTRITFFPPDETGWDWIMEWSYDEGETWQPVYKIRATPRSE